MPSWLRPTKSRKSRSKRRTSSTGTTSSSTGGAEPDRDDLTLDRERRVLRLLEQLDQPLTTLELGLRRLVEVGAEGGERLQVAVLGEVEAKPAGDRLHRLDLRVTTDPGHRDTDVDGRAGRPG